MLAPLLAIAAVSRAMLADGGAALAIDAGPPPPILSSAHGAVERLSERLGLSPAPDARHGAKPPPIAIVQIGDSHTEAAYFSHALSEAIAGGGAITPGFAWPGMLSLSGLEVARPAGRREWRIESWLDPQAPGPFGPRGTAFVAREAGAELTLSGSSRWPAHTLLTIYYGLVPGELPAELRQGDRALAALPMSRPPDAGSPSLGILEVPWPSHASAVVLVVGDVDGGDGDDRVDGGQFRFFGATVDRPDAAVRIDPLGSSGTSADHPLTRDDGAMGEFVQRRGPGVVIVWFGSNSARGPFDRGAFTNAFDALLDRVKEWAPQASLLVIGPPDLERRPEGCPSWAFRKKRALRPAEREAVHRFACTPESSVLRRPGRPTVYPAEGITSEESWQAWLQSCPFSTLDTISIISEAEREATLAAGGTFFDTNTAMGGRGSIHAWLCQDPPLADVDHTHLTAEGHARLVRMLLDAIRTGSR